MTGQRQMVDCQVLSDRTNCHDGEPVLNARRLMLKPLEGGNVKMRHLVAGALLLVLLIAGCGTDSTIDSATSGEGSKGHVRLGCPASEQTAVDLDVPGPGKSTPEEAVAPFADGPTTVVDETEGAATINALGADGTVARVFRVTQRKDGWWPDSYTECAG